MTPIETDVEEFIEGKFSVECALIAKNASPAGWRNECDEWRITLRGDKSGNYSFPFHTGLGLREDGKPKGPSVATILGALMRDGEAIDQSFLDWCDNTGADSDSRRALAAYDACCESGRVLRLLLTRSHLEQLSELLADY